MHTLELTHRSGPPLAILGVPFDNVTTQQTLDTISDMIASKRPHYVATANVDFTALAMHDAELRRVLLEAHLVVCDGMPLVWASRWLGNPLPERVAGSDVVPKLLALAEAKGWSVYFLGGQKEVAWRAVQNVQKRHPQLKVAGMMSPEFKPLAEMDHERICAEIRSAQPDILLVSFGCPKQEKWIAMNYERAGVPVTIGVGATIDFLAGHMKRAPRWMQLSGTEWAFRLAQEPKRLLKRYANDLVVFGSAIGKQWWLTRGGSRCHAAEADLPVAVCAPTQPLSCVAELPLPERLDAVEVVAIEQAWMERLDGPEEGIILDGSGTKFIDSTGLGFLMRLQKRCRAARKHLVLATCSKSLVNLLQMTRLHALFQQAANREEALLWILSQLRENCQPVCANPGSNPAQLSWNGAVTNGSSHGLWRGALGALHNAADACSSVVIDLHEVQAIDSVGLELMVRLKQQAASLRTPLRFTNPSRTVHDSLRQAQLEDWLLAA